MYICSVSLLVSSLLHCLLYQTKHIPLSSPYKDTFRPSTSLFPYDHGTSTGRHRPSSCCLHRSPHVLHRQHPRRRHRPGSDLRRYQSPPDPRLNLHHLLLHLHTLQLVQRYLQSHGPLHPRQRPRLAKTAQRDPLRRRRRPISPRPHFALGPPPRHLPALPTVRQCPSHPHPQRRLLPPLLLPKRC